MYRKIIVGYDEGQESEDALALGREIAGLAKSELLLAHIFPLTRHTPAPAAASLGGQRESRLAKVLDALPEEETPRTSVRVLGDTSAARGLQHLADLEGADVIVVGSHRSAHPNTGMAGTVAERLLNGSPCAVAVAPRGHAASQPKLRVLAVAFQDAAASELALRTAESMALAAEATLRVIAVAEPAAAMHGGSARPGTPSWDENPREALRVELHEAITGLDGSVRPLPVLESGDPAAVLADQAEAGVDLLVMGSRRYGPIRRVLLGSVSSVLMRRAPCPVLVVPRPHDVVEDRADADAAASASR